MNANSRDCYQKVAASSSPSKSSTFERCLQQLGIAKPGKSVAIMLIEDQRFIHEDLERLEQGIADRVAGEPRNVSI